ncbi:DNA internalization-related competence protein ComEC/Rec2 [Streptococcus phocae subsp. salmonis]|uniref:DNA internalization-related competence protein ComEC/Rec2 n=1 Tax=Streptococcus phocae TaxID=119224 RepID=UPI00053224E4|nr:DNA internalization-related competence protein ComEC/Rec2 [Streptococcus phocae]KGR72962.1 competence protein ComEC [Streptococcus phocae subsp. salmonis]
MILALIKRFPVAPIQLAFLVTVLYYQLQCPSLEVNCLALGLMLLLVRHFPKKQVAVTLLVLGGFALLFTYQRQQMIAHDNKSVDKLTRVAIIPDSIAINGDQLSAIGRYDGQQYQLFYKMRSKEEVTFFKRQSQWVTVHGDILLENPVGLRNFKGFNYKSYLNYQHIYRIGQIKQITALTPSRPESLTDYLSHYRRSAIVWSQQAFPKPMSHYMTGLLFGYLDKSFGEMTELYSQLGIIHLFALSGMQVSFFLTYYRRALMLFQFPLETIKFLEIPFSIVYSGMTGNSVSVIRSLVQALLRNVGLKGLDNFAVTFLLMFVLSPHFLMTIGGGLSFAYSFVLAVIQFEELSETRQRLAKSLAISVGILPFLLFYFATFNPISIVLTALLSYLFDLAILPVLTVLFIVSPVVVITLCNPLFVLLEHTISFVGRYFGSPLVFGSPSLLQLMICLVCLAVCYDYRQHKRVLSVVSVLFVVCLLSIKFPMINEVTMIDIGQGDSILIRDWRTKTILIDVGGTPMMPAKERWQQKHRTSNAQKTLIPYLRSRGISKIDQLVLTHTDTDHVGDMEKVVQAFKIKEILVSQGSLSQQQFVKRLRALPVKVSTLQAGDVLPIMGSQLQVLYPWAIGDGKNNDSLVLYGQLLDHTFLFTGDLEAPGEAELVARYPDLSVDVLKAGHHGSKGSTSPTLLDHIRPKIGLISAGRRNRYQHPHQETLQRFEERNIDYYRTDTQGAIRLTGWRRWHLETCQ